LQVEELEQRETPSGITVTPFFPHNPPAPDAPGQTSEHPGPIPMATGTFFAIVSLSGMSNPIVVPVNIDSQTGAHFSTSIQAGGLQIDLKGELNQAQGTVHFDCTISSNGQKVGTASGDGSFADPTCPTCRAQIESFDVTFMFAMTDGTTGSGTALLVNSPTT
jgi:hypothetical protein